MLYVREPDGAERVLLDPTALDPSGLTTLDAWVPDLEGRQLAYQLSRGGDEHSVLHVLDVDHAGRRWSRRSTAAATRRWPGCPGGAEFVLRPHGRRGRGARASRPSTAVCGGTGSASRRAGRAGRRPRPLRRAHLLRRARLPGRALARGHRATSARRAATASGSPTWHTGAALTPVLTQADDVQCSRVGGPRRAALPAHHRRRAALAARRHRSAHPRPRALARAGRRGPGLGAAGRAQAGAAGRERAAARAGPRPPRRGRGGPARDGDGTPRGTVPLPGTGSLLGFSVADRDTPAQAGRLWLGWTDLRHPAARCTASTSHRRDRAGGGRARRRHRARRCAPSSAVHLGRRHDDPHVRDHPGRARGGRGRRCVTGYGGFGISREPAYTASALAWVAAGGVLRGRLAARRRRGGRGLAPRGQPRQQAERVRRLPRRRRRAGRGGRHHRRPAGDHGRLQRRAARRRGADPAARPRTGPWSARRRCWTWCATRSSRWAAPGTTSTAPPPTPRSSAGCCPTRPTTTCSRAPRTRRCCSRCSSPTPGSTRCTPARCAPRCSTPPPATRVTRPILLRRETDVGHGARSVTRTVALAVDQLAFLAAHTGLVLARHERRHMLHPMPARAAPPTPGSPGAPGSTS